MISIRTPNSGETSSGLSVNFTLSPGGYFYASAKVLRRASVASQAF